VSGDEPGHHAGSPGQGEETGLLAILAALVRHEVEFVLIGGLAVGHHGYPRATKDVDVVPAPQGNNLQRLWTALSELEAEPAGLSGLQHEELPVAFSLENLLRGGNWDLDTRHGRLDIIQYREGAIESGNDYERLHAKAVRGRHRFGDLWVVGYEDLIDLKTLAGRDQDLVDIRALREANEDTAP
jgi:hypothetical protein